MIEGRSAPTGNVDFSDYPEKKHPRNSNHVLWHADRRLEKVANFLMSCRLIAKTDKKLEAKEFFRYFDEKRSTAT